MPFTLLPPVEADKKESSSVTEKPNNIIDAVQTVMAEKAKEKPIVEIVTVDIHSEADRESTAVIGNAQVI